MPKPKPLYLDYAASTPVDEKVMRAMRPYFSHHCGNPESFHTFGQKALAALDNARTTFATILETDFNNIVFTASATEANNIAIRSSVRAFRERNPKQKPHIIISSIEHASIFETAQTIVDEADVTIVPVDAHGHVSTHDIINAISPNTILVSLIYGNNETGCIQDVPAVARVVHSSYPHVLVHTDASQAFLFLECSFSHLGVDMITLSSHKIYGPKGVGIYAMSRAHSPLSSILSPFITGGGQEWGIRSATENVPAIVGCAQAARLAIAHRSSSVKKISTLKKYALGKIQRNLPQSHVNGYDPHSLSLPHIFNIFVPGASSQDIVTFLDISGIAISAGSACAARSLSPSRILLSHGYSRERALSSIRVSLGRTTTKSDIDRFVKTLTSFLKKKP